MVRIRLPRLILPCTLALLMATALPAGPDGRRGGHGEHGRGPEMMEHLAIRLDLTAAQREQLSEIVTRYHEGELAESRKALEEGRRQLGVVIHDATASEQQVLDAAAVVSARAQQAALTRHRMVVEIDRILTEEQRTKAREMHARREARSMDGHGHFPGED